MAHATGAATALICGVIGAAALGTAAQAGDRLEYPPAPCSVLSRYPCYPAVCSVFHRGPCFPDYGAPIGQGLRLTVSSSAVAENDKAPADSSDEGRLVNTLHDMFDTLRGCWVPPPKDKARYGMEYTIIFAFKRDGELIAPARMTYMTHDVPGEVRDTYREAVNAALKRCTPMHFSTGMAGAIAGRPISLRFIDDRMVGDDANKSDESGK
jgi:hypothetical protein